MKNEITIPASKHVLVIEDDQNRIRWFKHRLGANTFYATTPEGAITAVVSQPYDVVFFDRDAEGPYSERTFFYAAREMAKANYAGLVVIHTLNYTGARMIANEFRRYSDATAVNIFPFGTFDVKRA